MSHTKSPKYLYLAFALIGFLLVQGCGGGGGDDDAVTLSTNACPQIGLNTRVINGTECSEQGSPIVRIDLRLPSGETGLCSGTLLTPTYVLTAAHCFFQAPTSVTVRVNSESRSALRYLSHPNVSIDPGDQKVINDAALIELSQPFTNQRTLPLLGTRQLAVGNVISTFGYGLDENSSAGVLQSGEMQISDLSVTHIGARFNGAGSNPCFGDSGGPAIFSFADANGAEVDAVVGVVSSGELITCLEGDRTLFANTNTSSIFDFITANVPGVSVQ